MNRSQVTLISGVFLAGMLGGVLTSAGLLSLSGRGILTRTELDRLEQRQASLEGEAERLREELTRTKSLYRKMESGADLPYRRDVDARLAVNTARAQAQEDNKFLMITFGANWCLDCRNLHRQLKSQDVSAYTDPLFRFVNVDVGKFNQNRALAEELGVSLSRGIPVAIFFDPAGNVIGTTNEGQLEPARRYSSRQILKFVRDIAERSRIVAPDAVN